MLISVVVPVYNEEGNVPILYRRLKDVFNALPDWQVEFIFIDDGSRDATWQKVNELRLQDGAVKGLKLSRNFGQQNALTAGIDVAFGDLVITMDGDLQHPPELIKQMITTYQQGYDIVYTKRSANKSYGWYKKFVSHVYAAVFNKFSSVKVEQGVVDFRLMTKEVANQVRALRERNRFVRGLVSWVGFKSTYLEYVADERTYGKTNYSTTRALKLAFSSLISFSSAPLYISGLFGFVITAISFLYILYALYMKFFTNQPVSGWASILISVLFLGGIQLIAIGILGSYLATVYDEVKARPSYIIHQSLGLSTKPHE